MLKIKRFIIPVLATSGIVGLLASCGGGGSSDGGDDGPVFDPSKPPQSVEVVSGDRDSDGVRNVISWEHDPTTTDYRVYWSDTRGSSPDQCVLSEYQELEPAFDGYNYVVHFVPDAEVGMEHYYCVVAVSGDQTSVPSKEVFGIPQATITTYSLKDVVWNGVNTLVAVGDSGVILTSPNGTYDDWDDNAVISDNGTPDDGFSNSLTGITWDDVNNGYLAVGGGGTILSSSDGVNWEVENTNIDGVSSITLEDVAWAADEYIVVGNSGTVLRSPDGQEGNWTEQTIAPELTTTTLLAVTVGNNTVVISGTRGKIYTIRDKTLPWDGVDSTGAPNGVVQTIGNNSLNDVTWNGTHFGIVGGNDTVLSSPDGITWTQHVPGTPNIAFFGVVQWDSGIPADPVMAAVGSAGTFAISPDTVSGYSVPTHASYEETQLNAITWVEDNNYGLEYFVIVGNDGTVLTNQQ